MSTIFGFGTENFNMHYSITISQTPDTILHCHNVYELYFFKSGGVEYSIEGKKYVLTPNTLLLMPPHTFHGYNITSNETYERCVINFNHKALSTNFQEYLHNMYAFDKKDIQHCYQNTHEFNISSFFDNIVNCNSMEEPLKTKAILANFEALMYQIAFMHQSHQNHMQTEYNTPQKIKEMIIFINSNLENKFSLDELSNQYLISKHHLNKLFKLATGTTVMDYILFKKISMSQQLIIGGTPVSQVANDMGFNDYSNFYRSYKKIIGHSPSKDSKSVLHY